MAFEIEWLESAQADFDKEIGYVLEEFGFQVAKDTYYSIHNHVENIANSPRIGTQYEKLTYFGYEIRRFPTRQVTIFYSPQPHKVTILAVWNNHRNPDRLYRHLLDAQ